MREPERDFLLLHTGCISSPSVASIAALRHLRHGHDGVYCLEIQKPRKAKLALLIPRGEYALVRLQVPRNGPKSHDANVRLRRGLTSKEIGVVKLVPRFLRI